MRWSSSLMFSWTHSDSIVSDHHLGVSATQIRLFFCVRECTCPPPISISLSLASKCPILLLGQDDGLHYNVQSVEYPFSWFISPRWGPALKKAHAQMLHSSSWKIYFHKPLYVLYESLYVLLVNLEWSDLMKIIDQMFGVSKCFFVLFLFFERN